MDAVIGRYGACMEESGLVLRHPSNINFDLTLDETLSLLDFINVYKPTLVAMKRERDHKGDTEPQLK